MLQTMRAAIDEGRRGIYMYSETPSQTRIRCSVRMLQRILFQTGSDLSSAIRSDETGRMECCQPSCRNKIDHSQTKAFFIRRGDTFQIWKPETIRDEEKAAKEWLGRSLPEDFDRMAFLDGARGTGKSVPGGLIDMSGRNDTLPPPYSGSLLRPLLAAGHLCPGRWLGWHLWRGAIPRAAGNAGGSRRWWRLDRDLWRSRWRRPGR